MQEVIDFAALKCANLHDDPYPYAVIKQSFTGEDVAYELRDGFVTEGFVASERKHRGALGKKRYRMFNYWLIQGGQPDEVRLGALSRSWQQLMTEICSSRYRASLRSLTGIDLRSCMLEARMDRYAVGCWVEPHFDRPDKAVTHLFYFNSPWEEWWNGEFRVLRGSDMQDYAHLVFPYLGTSVVMVRSEQSWHGVPPVDQQCPYDRLSLLVQFVKPQH